MYASQEPRPRRAAPRRAGARATGSEAAAHPWKTMPIPRYDGSNALHRRLSRLAARSEGVAAGACAGAGEGAAEAARARRAVGEALRADGASGEIDAACAELLPRRGGRAA